MIVPRLCEGSGTIRCQHGILPVPVPAVSNIVSAHQLKLHITSVQGELITPTGAAIVAAFLTSEKLPEDFTVEKIGIGAGKHQYECPGILRAMLIRESGEEASGNYSCTEIDTIIKLESITLMTVQEKRLAMLWSFCMRQEPDRPITCLYL